MALIKKKTLASGAQKSYFSKINSKAHTQARASSTRFSSPTEQHSGRSGRTLHGAGPVAVLEQRIRLNAVRVLSCTAHERL